MTIDPLLQRLRETTTSTHIEALLDGTGVGDGFAYCDSPIGRTYVAFNDHGVSFTFVTNDEAEFRARHSARLPRRVRSAALPSEVVHAVETVDGRSLMVDLRHTAPFQRDVLLATRDVPAGTTQPYGWVADQIGKPKAVRAVGTALGHNPIPLLIPCHRVVKADGSPGQYLFGLDNKKTLLALEAR
jgi:methylated-DNA-[protein]-cysteine S-methyltransferase